MIRLIAATVLLGLAASARAEEMCGKAELSDGPVEVEVWVSRQGEGPPAVTWTHVEVWSADRSYRLGAHYRPVDGNPGKPTSLDVRAYIDLPDPKRADPEQMVWRADTGPWSRPRNWGNPSVAPTTSAPTRGEISYRLARDRPHAGGAELLEAAARGARFDFRRIDAWEREIGSGSVVYPAPGRVAGLYRAARAEALGRLRPCGVPSSAFISPAPPPPPGPPEPESPAMRQARACTLLRAYEERAAREQPQLGRRMKIVAQPVDCGARTVRRVYETEGISKRDRRELGATLTREAERMWCSDTSFRSFIAQGWTFTVELHATDDPAVYKASTRTCRG